jgi:hypothetical protein
LGKLTLQRDCGVSWRYQALAQACAVCSPFSGSMSVMIP